MVKIFLTGATGYIAGDALAEIYQAHKDYEYTLLVRTKEKGETVKKAFPSARIVVGDLDDAKLLKEEASKADIVLHAADASDNEGAAKSIRDGLIAGHSAENPGFWLHTGGAGILTYQDSDADRLGEWSDKQYNDLDGIKEILTLPDHAFHRNVDKIVLETGEKHGDAVKVAIVAPPTIYGKGRGPVSTRGRQVYEMANLVLKEKFSPIIGAGKARWNHIHVADISTLFLLLVDAAAKKNLDSKIWNDNGYYFTEDGEHIWGDLARSIGAKAAEMKYISEPKDEKLSKDTAMDHAGFEAVSWGLNSRAKALRAREVLGWKPKQQSLEAEIPTILKSEHERLQK